MNQRWHTLCFYTNSLFKYSLKNNSINSMTHLDKLTEEQIIKRLTRNAESTYDLTPELATENYKK